MKFSSDEFIDKCKKLHPIGFDFSNTTYKSSRASTSVVCKQHGSFLTTPEKILKTESTKLCPFCNGRLHNTQTFIEKSNKFHNGFYDYSKSAYVRNADDVIITCPVHGDFTQNAGIHMIRAGCPECNVDSLRTPSKEFIQRGIIKHNNRYRYDKVSYVNMHTKVIITCPKHGDFSQTPNNHLNGGHACLKCKRPTMQYCDVKNTPITKAKFLNSLPPHKKLISEYQTGSNKVKLLCSKHNVEFYQVAKDVNRYEACGNCRSIASAPENELFDFISSIYNKSIIKNDQSLIKPYELDFWLPDINIAIEFNGLYWHSENNGKKERNYHRNKSIQCKMSGIRLIHINENEWNNVRLRDIVKSRLSVFCKATNIIKYHARQLHIDVVNSKESTKFLEDNHIQGNAVSSINIGLYENNHLISLMTFGKSRFNKEYEYELIRFCVLKYSIVRGGASKLFNFFLTHYRPQSIISYSDLRWNTGNLYKQLGFIELHVSEPNYKYFKKSNVDELFSRHKFQKHKLPTMLSEFDEGLTEWENMKNNGYDRIWDCGNKVFVKYK